MDTVFEKDNGQEVENSCVVMVWTDSLAPLHPPTSCSHIMCEDGPSIQPIEPLSIINMHILLLR